MGHDSGVPRHAAVCALRSSAGGVAGDPSPGVVADRDPHRRPPEDVDEGGRGLPVVDVAERPLAQAHPGERLDGVGGAAVDLDEHHQTLVRPARGLELELPAAGHGHAHPEDLSRTKISVEGHGLGQERLRVPLRER
jgi:hypothetical protein